MQAKVGHGALFRRFTTLVLLLVLVGCSRWQRIPLFDETPQELPWIDARLGDRPLRIMVAKTEFEQEKGLMFRRVLQENEGMLFAFPFPQIVDFWMKNTSLSLDVVLFSPKLEITEFLLNLQPGTGIPNIALPSYQSRGKAQYALEVPAGSVAKWKLRLGERLAF